MICPLKMLMFHSKLFVYWRVPWSWPRMIGTQKIRRNPRHLATQNTHHLRMKSLSLLVGFHFFLVKWICPKWRRNMSCSSKSHWTKDSQLISLAILHAGLHGIWIVHSWKIYIRCSLKRSEMILRLGKTWLLKMVYIVTFADTRKMEHGTSWYTMFLQG